VHKEMICTFAANHPEVDAMNCKWKRVSSAAKVLPIDYI